VSFQFIIEGRSDQARSGRLITPHGEVRTPVFMPVGTVASVKGVSQEVLEELGVEILLSNTYHLYLRPGIEQIHRLGGLHRFMAWERPILTDSGGFQVFSLSQLRKVSEEGVWFRSHLDGSAHMLTPEAAMEAQIGLGADIIMALDECTEYPANPDTARQSMEMTLRWAERSKKYFEAHKHEVPWSRSQESVVRSVERQNRSRKLVGGSQELRVPGDSKLETQDATQSLFGILQGGMYSDLRRESAERTVELDFPGYAIGGLSVGEPRALTEEVLAATLPHLPKDKPRYVMGVGTPEEIVHYAAMGVDMMDCVLPTRAARHGLLYTSEGKLNIKNSTYAQDEGPVDSRCGCRVCARYSRAYLRHLYASGELLAQVLNTVHNLAFYLDTMRAVRHAILLGEVAEFLTGYHARLNSPAR
jgi:queuine tRNA-ribosyltransferase